jgi:hypothetical protein
MSTKNSDHKMVDNVNLEEFGYKPLELSDKSIFSEKLDILQPVISEYTFTNLWMWREYYKFAWKLLGDDSILLISLSDSLKIIAYPIIGKGYDKYFEELSFLKTHLQLPIELHRIPESDLEKIKNINSNISVLEDRDNWDYLYRREDLVNLPGKEYSSIRRKLNKFNREVKIEIEPLNSKNAKDCLQLQEDWCNLRSCEDTPSLDNEDKAIREILMHMEELDFNGFVVFHNNNVIGYSIDEKLNSNTAVTHIEKGDTEYFGLYQALNHIFADKFASKFEFINREQDLGVSGLRRAKESYNPIKYIKKYILELK